MKSFKKMLRVKRGKRDFQKVAGDGFENILFRI